MTAPKQRLILVVDDDDHCRSALADLLHDEGFAVVEASNGRVALDYLLGAIAMPGLILLDLDMPVMGGREMINALRKHVRFAELPIILVTGDRAQVDPVNREAVARLPKPVEVDELLALVSRHLPEPPAVPVRSRSLPR